MDSSVNLKTGVQKPSQIRTNEVSTPAPKFGGIKKKFKKVQLIRRARISLNTSTSGRKRIKTLATKINTSLNSSRIVKEALNHNNRALVTEQQRIQYEIKNMRQKCVDLVEENEDIVYELEMLNNLMNLTDSEEKVQAVVDMRVQAHMSQLSDEIEKTVCNFRQALRGVVSLRGLIKDPRRIMSMPLDSPRDDEDIQLSYMERLQEIFSNTDIYDDNDMINDDDNLPDNHAGTGQVNNTRGQGFVGLPQRVPCSSTVPEQHQVDTYVTNEFDEALEDDFDLNSTKISGNVPNFDQSNGKELLPDESHQPKYPRSKTSNMISTELSEDYNHGQEDTIMYLNTDMEMTSMIDPTLRSSLSPKSPRTQPVEPASSSVKSSPKSSLSSSKPSQSSSKSSQSSSSKSLQSSKSSSSSKSSPSSKSSQSTGKSQSSSSTKIKDVVSSSLLSSDQPVTKSLASSGNLTLSSSPASDFIDPEHTIYLNSDMEMTAVVEAPFSFIEPQPVNQLQKPSSFLQSLKTPIDASEKQNQNKVGKIDKFGPENLFGFEVETPKFNKPTKTTELSKIDKFERLKIETSFTLDKSLGDECLTKPTKSRSRTKPRSKKAVVEEIGIFNSEPSAFRDIPLMSKEKTKSTSIGKSQETSRSKRKLVQRVDDDFEDSEPCVLLTIPSEYTVPLNKESPSPKKSKPRSQSRGRSKSKKKVEAVISGSSSKFSSELDTKGSGEQGLIPNTYTVPMKKDSQVSNIKSTARSQSLGRSKTKKKKEIQSVDIQVNEETQEESNIRSLKSNKPKSISVSGDLSDVYTVPMKTDSPETKPRLRTRSQSRGRSKNTPDVSKDVLSSEASSDATTLPTKKHSPSKSVPADNSQNKEELKVQADSKNTYGVPLKDIACSKSKSRGRSQSRARSKMREVNPEDGNGTVVKALQVAVDTTLDHQNLKEAPNLDGKSDHSRNKRTVATQQDQRGDTNVLSDRTRTSQSTVEKSKKGTEQTKEHGEDMMNCSHDEDDVISPTVHIKPKCFRKRMIASDDVDSSVSQIKSNEIKKAVIDDDNDEMIPNSQPVKSIVPLRSKKTKVILASETDDELEDHNIKSSSNLTSSTKRKSESPIKSKTKKLKSISGCPKQSQILLTPEVLVIPDSTKKSRSSVIRDDDDDDEDQENLVGKRSRRAKGCVSYKEKPLNVKMRRETVDGKTVEYINAGRLSEKVRVSEIHPLDSVSDNRNSSS